MTVLRKFTQWLCLALFTLLLISCSGQLNDTTTITNDTNNQAAETNISDSTLSVHYIDVGQGDCTLVLCDGQSLLIDAGNNSKGTAIQLYLEKQGVKTLDYVIGTHPDADHIGGLDVVLYKFNCKTVILPDSEKDTRTYDDVLQTMQQKNYKNTLPEIGTTYSVGDASFEIITPSQEYG
ncbi:MAG: MBL fold metallo-hydrolase, partial [Lachnoclostridium sp.]|nr:MBL fold metallo-hydrolase [Lachnoclostridium sp.]